jgi:hypothetical protein
MLYRSCIEVCTRRQGCNPLVQMPFFKLTHYPRFRSRITNTPTTLVPAEGQLPAIIDGSGRKARDRIEHFLRAAIDNDNTRRAYGQALGSFFAC